jgi:hypothetical protein
MQTAEMIAGVSGAGGRLVEAEEGLVLARQHGLYVREYLVAKLCTVDLGTEPGQLVAAPAPACDETLACHGGTRIMLVNAPPTGLSEAATPSFHSVLSDLRGRSQLSPRCSAPDPVKRREHVARACAGVVTELGKMGERCGIVRGVQAGAIR